MTSSSIQSRIMKKLDFYLHEEIMWTIIKLQYVYKPIYRLLQSKFWTFKLRIMIQSCTESPVQRAPWPGRNANTCLSWNLSHLILLNPSITDVCKGAHVFHPILGYGSTLCLKCPHLQKWLIRTHHYRYSSKRIIHLRILKENGPTDLSFKMIKKRWSCRFF